MTQVKISELAEALALSGSEDIAIVQGGETRKLTIGTIVTQNANDISITGGEIQNLSVLSVTPGDSGATPSTFADDLVVEASEYAGMSILVGNAGVPQICLGFASDAQACRVSALKNGSDYDMYLTASNINLNASNTVRAVGLHAQSSAGPAGFAPTSFGSTFVVEAPTFSGMSILAGDAYPAGLYFGHASNPLSCAIISQYNGGTERLAFMADEILIYGGMKAQRKIFIVTETSKTLGMNDANTHVVCTNASAQTLTLDASFTIENELRISQNGAGTVTVQVPSGSKINGVNAGSIAVPARYKTLQAKNIGSNEWLIQ